MKFYLTMADNTSATIEIVEEMNGFAAHVMRLGKPTLTTRSSTQGHALFGAESLLLATSGAVAIFEIK